MRTVLIVDDYAPFRAAARALLDGGAFRVIAEAADGATALDAVWRVRPDVVLLDVQLPDEDGFAVCERILHGVGDEGESAGPPAVVMVSGRPISAFRRRLAATGARGFIPKTDLTPAALAEVLQPP